MLVASSLLSHSQRVHAPHRSPCCLLLWPTWGHLSPLPQHTANRVAIFAFTCERSVKARGKPPRRKGHGEGRGFFATESEGQAATPQGARDGGKKGKRRPCGLPKKFGPHNCHLPTYRPSHPSHLLFLLPTYSFFSSLSCFLRSRAAAHIVQQNVDARARRSLNKTLTRRHAARSTRRSCTRTNAAPHELSNSSAEDDNRGSRD